MTSRYLPIGSNNNIKSWKQENNSIGTLNSHFELLEPQATGGGPFDLPMLGTDNVSTTDATHGVSNGSMDRLMKTTPASTITRGMGFGEQPDEREQSWQFPTDLGVDIMDESSIAAPTVGKSQKAPLFCVGLVKPSDAVQMILPRSSAQPRLHLPH